MIFLTRLDGREMVVNDDHVLFVERTPDTVLTLTNGTRLLVKEPVEEVVARASAYRRRTFHDGPTVVPPETAAPSSSQ